MVAQTKTITSVIEQGVNVIKEAQDASTEAFNSFTSFAQENLPQILAEKFTPVVNHIERLANATEYSSLAQQKLPEILAEKFTPVVESMVKLVAATENKVGSILTVGLMRDRPLFTPPQQAQVFICMRALNRVEDLTIDNEPGPAQKNDTLSSIRGDALVQACLSVLETDEALKLRVMAVHREFPDSPPDVETQDRLKRFWEIQELRWAVIAHCAAQSPAAPGNSPQADEQPKQDQQS
jgi:hypothetical protein